MLVEMKEENADNTTETSALHVRVSVQGQAYRSSEEEEEEEVVEIAAAILECRGCCAYVYLVAASITDEDGRVSLSILECQCYP